MAKIIMAPIRFVKWILMAALSATVSIVVVGAIIFGLYMAAKMNGIV